MKSAITKFSLGLAGALMLAMPAHAESPEWVKQVTRLFAAKQAYPATAQMRGEEGTAKIKVYIGADGTVQKAEMLAGSGSALLDKEAMAVPAKVGRVPAPSSGPAIITVPMVWKLA